MIVPFTTPNQIVKKNKLKHTFFLESNERLIKTSIVFEIYKIAWSYGNIVSNIALD